MIAKISTVRNKLTGQQFEVVPGTLLPDFFEEVHPEIRVGEPKIEVEIEPMEPAEVKLEEKPAEPKKKSAKKSKKNSKKGAKKNGTSKN